MAILTINQPKYGQNFLPYRYPNLIEANGISNYDFFYSALNKTFYFKSDKNTPLTTVAIDFLSRDNAFIVNNTLTTP